MSFDVALRATEILFALAAMQQSAEHLTGNRAEKGLFGVRLVLCLAVLLGVATGAILGALLALALLALHRFQGPYNGGSDKMTLLILVCLCLAHMFHGTVWADRALGYLAMQLVLCYVISGWVKLRNPDWRSGQALEDVFRFSAYPVSESLRGIAERAGLMRAASWGVITFEIAFPLSLLHPLALLVGLAVAALFHLANALVFGLNRFFWIWLAAYPSLIWFQGRVFG